MCSLCSARSAGRLDTRDSPHRGRPDKPTVAKPPSPNTSGTDVCLVKPTTGPTGFLLSNLDASDVSQHAMDSAHPRLRTSSIPRRGWCRLRVGATALTGGIESTDAAGRVFSEQLSHFSRRFP